MKLKYAVQKTFDEGDDVCLVYELRIDGKSFSVESGGPASVVGVSGKLQATGLPVDFQQDGRWGT